jgi:hypothetical protein
MLACNTPRVRSMLAATLLSTVAAGPLSAQWTDLGCDLPGASGSPVLSGSGPLTPSSNNSVDLDNAATDALAMLFLAFEQNPVSFKGGVLKPVPFLDFPLLQTSPSGEIDLDFVWPNDLPDGFPFYMQYAVQDAGAVKGASLSNALRGLTPGPVLLTGLSNNDPNVGDAIEVYGGNFGNDPDDICALIVDDSGSIVGFTRAQSASGDTMTTVLGGVRPGSTTGRLMVNTGDGAVVPPQTTPPAGVTVLGGGTWVLPSDPADASLLDVEIDLVPNLGQDYQSTMFYQYLFGELDSNGWIELPMPEGDCPPGTEFWFQFDAASSGGTISVDTGAGLALTSTVDSLTCATYLCQEFQLAVLAKTGQLVTCIPNSSNNTIRLLPPPSETWTSIGSAYIAVCVPAVDCEESYGDVNITDDVLRLVMPTTTPDNAAISIYFEGETIDVPFFWNATSSTLPTGPSTPLQVATEAATALQDRMDDLGLALTASAGISGSDVVLEIAPSGALDDWFFGFLQMQICELQ